MESSNNHPKLLGKENVQVSSAEKDNLRLVEILFHILQGEFMYDLHTSAKLSSESQVNQANDGIVTSQMLVTVKIDVCAKPPSKKKLLSILYQLLHDYDSDSDSPLDIGGLDRLELVRNEDRLPHEWIWRLIENVSKPCKHEAIVHSLDTDPDMWLRTVHDCYDDYPLYALGSNELRALFASAKSKEPFCCDYIAEAEKEKKLVKKHGLTQTVDILNGHKRDCKHLTYQKKEHIKEVWELVVKRELHQMTRPDGEPQDLGLRIRPPPLRNVIAARVEASLK